jgi:glycosyltransferase involved in cell wall biosynthesis
VELRGWVDDDELASLRSRARAMAFPTLAEGFGLPVLEAMVDGLPVLASDLPVLREVGGDAALWFDPHDLTSIARAITVVSTEPERLPGLAAAGLQQAASFTWERVARETLAVFGQALAERR